jgi:predicted nucleotidyltransferase
MIRVIPSELDPEVVAGIDARLDGVERDERVRVVWAIESGSRAWGFPSPDSDYDGRFLYVRRRENYLSLWPERDVIETPLDAIFDVNGWDLAKTVRLLVKGNATVGEWLRSPIVYRGDVTFRDGMLGLAEQVADRVLLARHYLHVGRHQWELAAERSLKKVFYAVRPAATLRWLRVNPGSTVPPMNLGELLEQCEPRADVAGEIADLIELKAVTRELGSGTVPPAIKAFVLDEFDRADEVTARADQIDRSAARALAQEYFERAVETFAP